MQGFGHDTLNINSQHSNSLPKWFQPECEFNEN